MNIPLLSIVIATTHRETLLRTLQSIPTHPKIEIVLVGDDRRFGGPHKDWGAYARNYGVSIARGFNVAFMDDDDCYTENGVDSMLAYCQQSMNQIHIFMMKYRKDGRVLWKEEVVKQGNVGTPMMMIPAWIARRCKWPSIYEGDFEFLKQAVSTEGVTVKWLPLVTSIIG